MTKRLLLLLCLMMTAWSATWANNVAEGALKNGKWYITDTGWLYISVGGEISNFKEGTAPWYPFSSEIDQIYTNATAIGNYAFYGLDGVWNIEAEEATKVGKYAFYECGHYTDATTLYLPKVKTVELCGFMDCHFERIILPTVQTVGDYAFAGSDSRLKYLDLGSKVTSLGVAPFNANNSLKTKSEGNPGVFISAPQPPTITDASGAGVTMYLNEKFAINYQNKWDTPNFQWCGYMNIGSIMYEGSKKMIGTWFLGGPEGVQGESLCARYFQGIPDSHGNLQAPWASKLDLPLEKRVCLLGGFTQIPSKLLYANTSLQEVYISPDASTFVSVGSEAFKGCTSLKTVRGEDVSFSLKGVGSSAFNGCTALTSVPKIKGSIGASAFFGCSKLNVIDFADATSIGESAFERCTSMMQMKATSATDIGKRAFYSTRVVELRMGSGIKNIGNEAFAGRPTAATVLMTHIYIEAQTPPSVDYNTFQGFSKAKTTLHTAYGSAYTGSPWNGFTLSTEAYPIVGDGWRLSQDGILTITKNVQSLTGAPYDNPWTPYIDEVKTIIIENGVTQIGDFAFYHAATGTSRLTTVSIPVSLEKIGACAFTNHDKLQTIFVDNIKEMGTSALAGCTSLTRIAFGDQVERLGAYILKDTPNLKKFEIYRKTPPQLDEHTFDDMGLPYEFPGENEVKPAYAKMKAGGTAGARRRAVRATVPEESFVEYVTTPGWDRLVYTDAEHGDILGTGKEYSGNIGEAYYYRRASWILYADGLLEMSCPDELLGIDRDVHRWNEYASRIDSIVVHNGPTTISGLFNNLPNLKSITLPESVTKLKHTFYGCTSLETVNFPYVEEIEDFAALSADGNSLESGTFGNCTSLKSVSLPNAKKIGDDTFQGCTSLTDVDINPTEYGWRVFKDCTSLTDIVLGEASPTTGMFEGCTSLTSVTLNDAPSQCFKGCTSLTTVTLSDKIESMGYDCFANTGLKTIYISTPNPPCVYNSSDDPFNGVDRSKITCYVPADYVDMYKNSNIWKDMKVVADESYEEALIPTGGMIGDYGVWTLEKDGLFTIDLYDAMTDVPLYLTTKFYTRYMNTILFTDNCTSLEKGEFFFSRFSANDIRAKELFLGRSITTIGYRKFSELSYLTDVYCFAEVPPTMLDGGYDWAVPFETERLTKNNTTLHVLKQPGVKEAYEQAKNWKDFPNIVADLDIDSADEYVVGLRSVASKVQPTGDWYSLDGQKLPGMPNKAGIYVVGGKKVVIK